MAATLATASLGAIWTSCSPDFGVQGVLDRFGQIEPKLLFCADGYLYGGNIKRKMKLLEKQKKGKKRMLARGRVDIPHDVFLKVVREG